MKDLSKEQLKLVEDLVHPEKDAFIEWYTGEFNHDWQLVDLRNKPKIAEETIKNISYIVFFSKTILYLTFIESSEF